LTFSAEQARQLVKGNKVINELLKTNIISKVDQATAPLKATVAQKDEEIAKLKSDLANMPSAPSDSAENGDTVARAELERQLEVAKQERENAVRQAVDSVEKKVKVQLNMRDIAMAKIAVVKKAVQETPEKPVKEVWELADKARLPPPGTPTTAKSAPATSSPTPAAKPTPAQTSVDTQASQPATVDKMKARSERFGTTGAASAAASPTTATGPGVGRPATGGPATNTGGVAPVKRAIPAPGTTTGLRRMSSGVSSGIPGPGSIPQGKGPCRPGSRAGSVSTGNGLAIAGAAGAGRGAARGGGASALPRGGARGGFGAPSRGGIANAGMKRQHDGGDGGDGNKRMRGGGQGGSG
jgi:nucleoprotein TPR